MPARRPTSPESRVAQGRLAAVVRTHGPDSPAAASARAVFESESYLAAVRAAVADAPPLTAEQRARLRGILSAAPVADDRTPELVGGAA